MKDFEESDMDDQAQGSIEALSPLLSEPDLERTFGETARLPREHTIKRKMRMPAMCGQILQPDGRWQGVITYPGCWRSAYMFGIIIMLSICTALTMTIGEIDWEDNVVLNKFGFNSICLMVDYKPAIFVGPFLYSLCLYCMSFYILCQVISLHELLRYEKISPLMYWLAMSTIVLEMLSAAFFSTIFAISVESIYVHAYSYIAILVSFILSSGRTLLMERHLETLEGWRSWFFWLYHGLFIVVGFLYVLGMWLTLQFDIFMWKKMKIDVVGVVIDKIATFLLLLKVFTFYFVRGKMEFRARSLLVPWIEERESSQAGSDDVECTPVKTKRDSTMQEAGYGNKYDQMDEFCEENFGDST